VTAALELLAASKSYGWPRPQPALRAVSLRVERGESYGLAGPNGAGKTTLIRLLLGLAAPDAGEVRLLGGNPEDPELRRRVGFVPEACELPTGASPRALVRRWVRLRGLQADCVAQGLGALERLGMGKLLDRPAGRLSKGERQRTLLALALLGEPELLILDEPTDGLDPLGRALVREVVRGECAAGRTVFLNSHLLEETERICSRVGILSRGVLVREARPGARVAGGAGRSRMLFDRSPGRPLLEAVGARVLPTERRRSGEAAAWLEVAHEGAGELNRRLDLLRTDGALLLELRPERADLEADFVEAVTGDLARDPGAEQAAPVAAALEESEHSPRLPVRPLRATLAIGRVAEEIAAELSSQKVGWVVLLVALLWSAGFLYLTRSELVQSGVTATRALLHGLAALQARQAAQEAASVSARVLFWLLLTLASGFFSSFAVPLFDPRRTVLLLAQPISRTDHALGVFASALGLAGLAALGNAVLLFVGLRWVGLEVPWTLLLVPLPIVAAFAPVYLVGLLATLGLRSALLSGSLSLGAITLLAFVGAQPEVATGAASSWVGLAYSACPKLAELGRFAGRLAAGARPDPGGLVSTLLITAALAVVLAVVAERSER
jgi:ABC-2 type transport system ATP-binding protein